MLKQNLGDKKIPNLSIGICLSLLMLIPLFHICQASAQSEPETTVDNREMLPAHVLSNVSEPANPEIATEETDRNNDLFFNPPNRGAPKRTADAGSRGICPVYGDNHPVTLLIPNNDNTVTIAASTVSEYPTFLWYIPQVSQLKQLGFTLIKEDTDEIIYQTTIAVPHQAGIMSFQLPETATPLKVGDWYHWVLSVSSFEDQKTVLSSPCYADAYIGRRPLNSTQQQELIDAATNLEDIWNFYTKEIIWYDALATLDQMRRQNPEEQTLNRKWQAVLGLIGLSELSAYPPVETSESDETESSN